MTRCSRLTGPGRSAIAVVAIQGPDAARVTHRCARFASPGEVAVGQIRYANWTGPTTDETEPSGGESVVITAVGPDDWEIHCHGGSAAIERVMEDLRSCGVESVAELPTSSPRLVLEAESVLSRCLTDKTAAIALSQIRGGLLQWAQNWLAQLSPIESRERIQAEAHAILESAAWSTRMTEPWNIVLVGAPNVGKSSLLNALVGFDRSITYDQAGTTRDVLHAETVIDGLPVRLSDTAGIRDGGEPLEAEGMRRAINAAESADLIIQVHDACGDATAETAIESSRPRIRVLNKIDLVETSASRPEADVMTSAVTGEGIEDLLHQIGHSLNQNAPAIGSPAVLNERQLAVMNEIATASPGYSLATTLQQLIGEP